MGDLTFKPASGGDLILQNDDAGAKIQLNNDDTIDITGSIDTATFNGTVGSSATFQSGMPVQIYRSSINSNNDHSVSTSYDNHAAFVVTNKRANSKFYLQASCIVWVEGDTINNYAIVGINTSSDGTGTFISWSGDSEIVEKMTVAGAGEVGTCTVGGYVADTGSIAERTYYLVFRPSINGKNINLSIVQGLLIEYI